MAGSVLLFTQQLAAAVWTVFFGLRIFSSRPSCGLFISGMEFAALAIFGLAFGEFGWLHVWWDLVFAWV